MNKLYLIILSILTKEKRMELEALLNALVEMIILRYIMVSVREAFFLQILLDEIKELLF